MSTEKMYTLKSSDNESFEVEESVAMMSQTIKHIIEDDCSDNEIPLPNITAKVLAKVIEYCKKHKTNDKDGDKSVTGGDDLKGWDKDFINVDVEMLFDLIRAANNLNIKDLLDLMCQTAADMVKGKSPEEIYKFFFTKNDFTPEKEAAVRKGIARAFE